MIDTDFKRICVVGLGYIGLPTAAILASRGIEVVGVDLNGQAVETINSGNIHIVEPDLDIVVRSAVQTGQLKAYTKPQPADAFILAVPTPLKENNCPNVNYIMAAVKAIAPVLKVGNLIVLESTSPVGTTEKVAEMLTDLRPDFIIPQKNGSAADLYIAHCPERVLPGSILQELVANDRVIGGITPECSSKAIELYMTFVKGKCYPTNARTAELSKLTENASRDVNIAFANELSLICDSLEINVWELIDLANKHPRVNVLQPGPGVGGHCIAVDPWFIVDAAPEQAKLIRTARQINDYKPHWVVEKVKSKAERFKKPVVGCFGLTFKANIDDLRESPALEIAQELHSHDVGEVLVCEPYVKGEIDELISDEMANVLKKSDILVFLVAHDAFKRIDREMLKEKVVIDVCGLWK